MDLKNIDLREYDDIKKMIVFYYVDFTDKDYAKSDNLKWNPELKHWTQTIENSNDFEFETIFSNNISKKFPIKKLVYYDNDNKIISISDEAENKLLELSRFYQPQSKTGFNFLLYETEKQQRKKLPKKSNNYTFGQKK